MCARETRSARPLLVHAQTPSRCYGCFRAGEFEECCACGTRFCTAFGDAAPKFHTNFVPPSRRKRPPGTPRRLSLLSPERHLSLSPAFQDRIPNERTACETRSFPVSDLVPRSRVRSESRCDLFEYVRALEIVHSLDTRDETTLRIQPGIRSIAARRRTCFSRLYETLERLTSESECHARERADTLAFREDGVSLTVQFSFEMNDAPRCSRREFPRPPLDGRMRLSLFRESSRARSAETRGRGGCCEMGPSREFDPPIGGLLRDVVSPILRCRGEHAPAACEALGTVRRTGRRFSFFLRIPGPG